MDSYKVLHFSKPWRNATAEISLKIASQLKLLLKMTANFLFGDNSKFKNLTFRTAEYVGMYFSQVSIADDKLAAGPLVAKVYDASLIKVTDVGNAIVGQQCQFRGK